MFWILTNSCGPPYQVVDVSPSGRIETIWPPLFVSWKFEIVQFVSLQT